MNIINQSGTGLPEILIGLLLSTFIMTGLMHQYLSTKWQLLHIQTALDASTERQLVADLIRTSTHKAGFTPCLSINRLITVDQRDGHKNLTAIEVDTTVRPTLRINRMSDSFTEVSQILSPIKLLAADGQPLSYEHPVLIADCYHAEVQFINNVAQSENGQTITLDKPLAFDYQLPVYIGAWVEEAFFVREGKSGKKGLFYQAYHTDELSRLVNAMSLNLHHYQTGTLLQITLGLVDAPTVEIDAKVRAS